ncbi:MAG: TIGR03087 family PEP-CTERM/XrtA system glycosyltransferase [Planctomycetota bacterium]
MRSYNLLRVLCDTFDVTLACPHDEPIEPDQMQHVEELCESVITEPVRHTRWLRAGASLLGGKSLTEGLFSIPSLQRKVQAAQQSRPFDVAFVFCSSMFPYVRNELFRSTPRVVDVVDVDSEKWRQMGEENRGPKRWIYKAESRRVKQLEHEIGSTAHSITLVSESEARLFDEVASPPQPSLGVSNGVDAEYFSPPSTSSESDTRRLVFTGVMDYPPNVEGMCWFCSEVLPTIRQRHDIQLDIVGRNPTRKVVELGELPGVNVTSAVPDVRPFLHRASIAISPLHLARGIQNKVLEAMAAGLPVISTPQAATGIDGVDGEHFLIVESTQQWCDALDKLIGDEHHRTQMGRAARDLVVERYAWPAKLAPIQDLLNEMTLT